MFDLFFGVTIALYTFSRKTIINEPYKSKIDTLYNKAHNNIKELFTNDTREILLLLSKFCLKIFLYCSMVYLFLLFLPENIFSNIKNIIITFILTFFLIYFSINWILKHKKTIKEYVLNYHFIFLSLAPIIFYIIDKYLITQEDIIIFQLFEPLMEVLNINIFLFQLIWIASLLAFQYIGPFIIAIPVFILSFSFVFLLRKIIYVLNKYVNNLNIIDAIFGFIILSTPIIRYLMK